MTKKNGLPYEQAAEQLTVTGWVCKTCHRFFGDDEHAARWCCASELPCDKCGGRNTDKEYTCCKACRAKNDAERWAALLAQAVEWNGETPLTQWRNDHFFWSPDAVVDYAADHDISLEDMQLVLAEPGKPRWFSMADYLCDDLPDDFDDKELFDEIDKTVNDFIEAGPNGDGKPWAWFAGNRAVTLASVRMHCELPDSVGDAP